MLTDKTKQFIENSILLHQDKYDYSKVNYENNLKEVIIICKIHGEFLQLPKTHKRGNGCIKCGLERTKNAKTSNSNDFIQKAKLVHGDHKYDYSKVVYKKAIDKVIIICNNHGDFLQTPNSHLDGSGCKKCSDKNTHDSQRSNTTEFISNAIEIHEDKYDYSKVYYENNHTNIIIICKIHGDFEQLPINHLKGRGCKECGKLEGGIKRRNTTEDFIKNAIEIHGNKFNYSKVEYINCDKNIIIICKEHGEFKQTPSTHLNGSICCQKCVLNNIGNGIIVIVMIL